MGLLVYIAKYGKDIGKLFWDIDKSEYTDIFPQDEGCTLSILDDELFILRPDKYPDIVKKEDYVKIRDRIYIFKSPSVIYEGKFDRDITKTNLRRISKLFGKTIKSIPYN